MCFFAGVSLCIALQVSARIPLDQCVSASELIRVCLSSLLGTVPCVAKVRNSLHCRTCCSSPFLFRVWPVIVSSVTHAEQVRCPVSVVVELVSVVLCSSSFPLKLDMMLSVSFVDGSSGILKKLLKKTVL